MKVMGIDPGYAITGWGVIESSGSSLNASGYGAILTDVKLDLPERLFLIQDSIRSLIREHSPDILAVEKLFFAANKTTAEAVLEARGVILAAAGEYRIRVSEFGPGTVKKAVTGSGSAKKADVILMVHRILGLKEIIKLDDTCDALACALTGIFINEGITAV
jgi:crossover junction endodeoxyribonuclease RuvC